MIWRRAWEFIKEDWRNTDPLALGAWVVMIMLVTGLLT